MDRFHHDDDDNIGTIVAPKLLNADIYKDIIPAVSTVPAVVTLAKNCWLVLARLSIALLISVETTIKDKDGAIVAPKLV